VRAVDYDSESDLVDALRGQQVVLNVAGFPGLQQQFAIIAAAEKAGVQWYLPSEFGYDLSQPEIRRFPFYATKIAVRDALEKSSLSYTSIVNGLFADQFVNPFYNWDSGKHTISVPGSGDDKISFTHRRNIGSFALAVLRRYDQFKNTTARVADYTLSYKDWVAVVGKATGSTCTVINVAIESLEQRVAANVDNTVSRQWIANQLHIVIGTGSARVDWGANGFDNSKLSEVKPAPFDEVLAENLRH
ncbi:NAD(P)-binding protein, partial [Martensiomyces pterosporus]